MPTKSDSPQEEVNGYNYRPDGRRSNKIFNRHGFDENSIHRVTLQANIEFGMIFVSNSVGL
jgi:hypothetical protein